MLGNGWTYLILGHAKESVDHYTGGRCSLRFPLEVHHTHQNVEKFRNATSKVV